MSHYHGFDAQTNHTPSIAHTRVLFAFSISSSEGKQVSYSSIAELFFQLLEDCFPSAEENNLPPEVFHARREHQVLDLGHSEC